MKIHGIKNIFFLLLLIFTGQALIADTILFDYHKVLALKDKNRGFSIKGFFSKENIWEKVAENPKGLFYYFYDMAQKPKDIDSSGGFYAAIARKNGLFKLATLTEKYSSEQYVPNRDLIALVEQLKAQGHTILLASNLDPRLLYIEINKSMGHMGIDLKTNLFTDLIKGGLVVSYNQFRSPADKTEVEGLLANNLAGYKTTDYAKPNVKFFQDYLQMFSSEGDVYFVDDKLDNVNAAQKTGIKGFHYKYEDDKTPDKINATAQLEQQFRNAGLLGKTGPEEQPDKPIMFMPPYITEKVDEHYKNKIDKQKLVNNIKADIYSFFIKRTGFATIVNRDWIKDFSSQNPNGVRETPAISKSFIALGQGYPPLAGDLEMVYASFYTSKVNAQDQLDKFCAKWDLPLITVP